MLELAQEPGVEDDVDIAGPLEIAIDPESRQIGGEALEVVEPEAFELA
jgi:hypothetical protein